MEVDATRESCCNCGVLFWITTDLYNELMRTKKWFYCPNGHAQAYSGKTDTQKLKDAEAKLSEQRDRTDNAWEATNSNGRNTAHQLRRIAGYKGQVAWVEFVQPFVVWDGAPCPIGSAMALLSKSYHGALDPVEGAVWRVERNKLIDPGKGGARAVVVDYLAKFVRPDKVDGMYLPALSGKSDVWNVEPESLFEGEDT
jgi:hypothetical protein